MLQWWPEQKIWPIYTSFLLGSPIFRCYVSFRECSQTYQNWKTISSWWFHQPIWKNCVKLIHLPKVSGWKFQKNLANTTNPDPRFSPKKWAGVKKKIPKPILFANPFGRRERNNLTRKTIAIWVSGSPPQGRSFVAKRSLSNPAVELGGDVFRNDFFYGDGIWSWKNHRTQNSLLNLPVVCQLQWGQWCHNVPVIGQEIWVTLHMKIWNLYNTLQT